MLKVNAGDALMYWLDLLPNDRKAVESMGNVKTDGPSLLRCTPEEAKHMYSKLIEYNLNHINDGEQHSYCSKDGGRDCGQKFRMP